MVFSPHKLGPLQRAAKIKDLAGGVPITAGGWLTRTVPGELHQPMRYVDHRRMVDRALG